MSIFKKKEKIDKPIGKLLRKTKKTNSSEILEDIKVPKFSLLKSKFKNIESKNSNGSNEKILKGRFSTIGRKSKYGKLSADKLVSMDFDAREIKFVYGKIQGKKINLEKVYSISFNENYYNDGYIEEPLGCKEKLEEIFKIQNISTKNLVCTIRSSNIIKREIVVPKIDKKDMDSLLHYEMEQYLPIDPSEYIIQYIEVEEFIEEEVAKLRLLVAVVPKNIVEPIFDFVSKLNLIPYAMDEHTNSMRKLVEFNNGYINNDYVMDKCIVFLDIGNVNINVMVFKDGRYKFNTILDIGYKSFLNIVSDELGIVGEELIIKTKSLLEEVLKDYYGENSTNNDMDTYEKINKYLENILFKKLEIFIGEIDQSLKYYTTQSDQNKIDKIYIYGVGVMTNNLLRLVEDKLDIPTDNISFMECVLNNDKENKDLSKYWDAIGAIIRL